MRRWERILLYTVGLCVIGVLWGIVWMVFSGLIGVLVSAFGLGATSVLWCIIFGGLLKKDEGDSEN